MADTPSSVFDADSGHYASDGSRIGTVKDRPGVDLDANRRKNLAEFQKSAAYDVMIDAGLFMDPAEFDASVADALYPQFQDMAKRKKALCLYVDGDMDLAAVAEKLDVPLRTAAKWAEVGRWDRIFESMAKTLRELERSRLSINRVKRREEILNEQLDLARKIRREASSRLDSADTAGQLKCAAESAKLAADMEVRALGVGESGGVSEDAPEAKKADGKVPLVINFNGLPPVTRSSGKEAIDV